jgi:nicotinamide-nucleotide amidase
MKAYIITIGDEILIGQVLNTNAAFIGEKLSSIGVSAEMMTVVGDDEEKIVNEFTRAWNMAEVIIVTGGLGPTHDDVTRASVCTFFGTDLVFNPEVRANIEKLLQRRNYRRTKAADDQALVPRIAFPIPNRHGTAPGYWIERQNRYFCVMPGVPYEMKSMVEEFVLPRLSKLKNDAVIRQRVLKTTGIPESFLAEKMGDIKILTGNNARLAFLPSPTGVRLRITARAATTGEADVILDTIESRIRDKVGRYIYAVGEIDLELIISRLLTERKISVSVAESCTGGLISDRLTDVPGSSVYFHTGIIAYHNDAKINLLGIPPEVIERYGAVSKEVALAMAEGIRRASGTNIGLSVTGIAGPGGGTPEKPVGLVWIGYADANGSLAMKFDFGDERRRVKERASQATMELLRRKLLQMDIEERMNTD